MKCALQTNGIIVPWLRADATVTRVGAELGGESGTVLDYVVASDQVLRAIRSLKIEDNLPAAWSDHRPVRFRWQGRLVKEDALTSGAPSERGPVGFKGNPSAEQKKDAVTYFASDPRLSSVYSTIENASPEHAISSIMEIVRDAWAEAGIDISVSDGSDHSRGIFQMPVSSW